MSADLKYRVTALPSQGFKPMVSGNPVVLVLGSLPSAMSLQRQEYYGNPRNLFWAFMGELFGAGTDLDYKARVRQLTSCRVAVWDVLQSAVRPGSLDSAIEEEASEVNDFSSFFTDHPSICLVAFNGKAAQKIFQRRVFGVQPIASGIEYLSLPSTSPAHAAMSYEDKLKHWTAVKNATMQYT